jgi:hypothetical protein
LEKKILDKEEYDRISFITFILLFLFNII